MPLELRKARPEDFPALQQMLEFYQYDLSDIWPQDADTEAKYGYNLERYKLGERFHAHVALVGHCIWTLLKTHSEIRRQVCEMACMMRFDIFFKNNPHSANIALAPIRKAACWM